MQTQNNNMHRTEKQFIIKNLALFKEQLFVWGNQHQTVAWLDSNESISSETEALLAINSISDLETSYHNAFHQLENYIDSIQDYAFGFLGYDLKNDVEHLTSKNTDTTGFPDLYFFQPKKIIEVQKEQVVFKYPLALEVEIEQDWQEILATKNQKTTKNHLTIKHRIDKSTYITQVKKALQEIHLGNVYELNFCQEFYAENAFINAANTYLELNKISETPFATYLRKGDLHLLSASPERFLQKKENQLLSEPIKGTAKRDLENLEQDFLQKSALQKSTKEIAENIMIVDLVRNDLSHIAERGSVKVIELCKIYSFKQVHQMISSIQCRLKQEIHPVKAIKACYPMGSMTGAPKIAAMQLIESLENTKRSIYSGSVGYFTPNKDFDFNVVIRSIVYNATKKYVSFSVGSAITAKAEPEKEYDECLLKARAMRSVLTN